MRLSIVVDWVVIRGRRRAEWSRLCVEVCIGILVKVLELFALVVFEAVLSKENVSPPV